MSKECTVEEVANCPMRDLISCLGDKWSMLILVSLQTAVDGKALRFSELLRGVHGISQRMLTLTLRNLERDGIVTRHVYPEIPPRVEYALTKRGKNFLVPVKNLVDWLHDEWPNIEKSRQAYDASAK